MNNTNDSILERIRPSKDEKTQMLDVSKKILSLVEDEARKIDKRIYVSIFGSASRDTWLKDEKDLDVFMLFPVVYDNAGMEKIVTKIGEKLLKNPQKRFAEHPYVKGYLDGFEVEIVPCYSIDCPEELKSSVDRTPFHDKFVRKYITDKEDDVRLLKQFLRGIGCYGAEAKVEGFSGYLCELLVIKFGSFEKVMESASGWKRRAIISFDNVDEATETDGLLKKFSSPLIIIDPVDENRNVASALSLQNFFVFSYAAKEYLKKPKNEFFFPKKREVEKRAVLNRFKKRGTKLISIITTRPDEVVDDTLYPQLKKAASVLEMRLMERDFRLLKSGFFVHKRMMMVLELQDATLPNTRLHRGPEVNSRHESRFLEKYHRSSSAHTRPFIKNNRWYVFLERKDTDARTFLEEFLSQNNLQQRGVPKHVAHCIENGFSIETDKEVFVDEFLPDLQEFFDPVFGWER